MPDPATAPDPSGAARARAAVLADLGRWGEAATVLEGVLAHDPHDAKALGELARARIGAGDPRGALEAADALVAERPDEEWGHRLRSIALRRVGRPLDALAAARESVRLDPEAAYPRDALARAHFALWDYAAARAAAEAWRRLTPDDPDAHAFLATIALRTRRWAEAETHARAALAHDAAHEDALHTLAEAQLGLGRGREAVVTAFDSARLAPGGAAPARFVTMYTRYLARTRWRLVILTVIVLGVAYGLLEQPIRDHAPPFVARHLDDLMRVAVLAALIAVQFWRTARLPAPVRAALRAHGRAPEQRYWRGLWFVLRGAVLVFAGAETLVVLARDPSGPRSVIGWAVYVALIAAAGWIVARWWTGRRRRHSGR